MKIYLVGGAVRDQLLGLPIKERDWVVVGATVQQMLALGYRQVGKEFPVFLHPKTNEEYALTRLERKVKPGYKGFVFDTSPEVALEDDLQRRDLTINAMAQTEAGQLIDPYQGAQDLQNHLLRHVSPAFAEDPVRILRVGRFLARYATLGFTVASETLELMQQMVKAGEVDALVAERVWKELERALNEPQPEKFFEVLQACHALPILFPELKNDGPGIAALRSAIPLTAHLPHATEIRFAALLHAVPEDLAQGEVKQALLTLCQRYRVPNTYKTLALLVALHHQQALSAPTLSAEQLLELCTALDIFRRPERFQAFLVVCQSIANATHLSFDPTWLNTCATVVSSVHTQALFAQELTGSALALQLKQLRLTALQQWLAERSC